MYDRRRLRMHVLQHVANALAPVDDLLQWKRLVMVVLHDFEEILTADIFKNKVGTLPLFDQIVDPRYNRNAFQGTEDFRFASEEVQADGEFLGIGTDHLLDSY